MAWRVANSLLTARGELDKLYPRRPKTGQEGTIGNTQHVTEGWTASDHNPWVTLNGIGVVRAWDIDCTATADQIASGDSFDPNALAEYLAQLQRARFNAFGTHGYVIWNRRITTSGNPGGVWQKYNGSDPHDRHIHVSVGVNPSEYDSTEPWNLAAAFGKTSLGNGATPITPPAPPVQEDDDMPQMTLQPGESGSIPVPVYTGGADLWFSCVNLTGQKSTVYPDITIAGVDARVVIQNAAGGWESVPSTSDIRVNGQNIAVPLGGAGVEIGTGKRAIVAQNFSEIPLTVFVGAHPA